MKTSALLILLVAVALAVAFFIFSKPAYPLTEDDARKFFLEDLAQKYPNADVREVMEILPVAEQDGGQYFQLKARVTTGLDSACPERLHVYYDYPPKNFVAQPPDYITKGCNVCLNEPTCILAFPEEAIIASHTYFGTERVAALINSHTDAKAEYELLDSYMGETGVWRVRWTAENGTLSYTAYLSKTNNMVLGVVSGEE